MERRDIIVIIVAVFIVLIMAMYIKPLVTGKPVQLVPEELAGIFGGKNQTQMGNNTSVFNDTLNSNRDVPSIISINPTNLSAGQVEKTITLEGKNLSISTNVTFVSGGLKKVFPVQNVNGSYQVSDVSLPEGNWSVQVQNGENGSVVNSSFILHVAPIVTPVPTWNGSSVNVGFQNGSSGAYMYPRNYPVDSNPVYSFSQQSTPLISYTTFSGQYSAKTNSFHIPTGYWELWYTVEVSKDLSNPAITKKSETTETDSKGRKVIPETTDSISVVNPQFSIQVNNDNTGKEVRTVIPPGGLNPRLWSGDFVSPNYDTEKSTEYSRPAPTGTISNANWDPRPWKEKFYEGYQNYTLDVNAQNLISYSIEIKVPEWRASDSNRTLSQADNNNMTRPGTFMENTMKTYIGNFNGNISDSATFGSIIGTLSQSYLSQHSRDDIYRSLSTMKNSGITITGFQKTDSYYQGPEGSLKGDLTYTTKTGERTIPVDIPYIQQNDGWKINDLPLIRL